MRYWRYYPPFGGGLLRIWKWIKAWLLLFVLRSLKCESHNHGKGLRAGEWRFHEESEGANKWACARCFRILCWSCEGTAGYEEQHEDGEDLDAVCDNCWSEITKLREAEREAT